MDLDAFVLVGGRSSRLGRHKALVELGGMALAERAAATLSDALSPRSISLVAANEEQFPTGTFDRPLIFDIYPVKGATGAVHAALYGATTEWAAILACDLPFVTAGLIHRLAAMVSADIDAIFPVQPDGRVQPLCALYRVRECHKYLEGVLKLDDEMPALAALTDSLRTRLITFDEMCDLPGSENFFLNINTSGDLKTARSVDRHSL